MAQNLVIKCSHAGHSRTVIEGKCEVGTARMIRNVRDQVDSENRGAECLRSAILVCFLHQTEN